MSGVKDSYETAATADYVIPPPYKQLPRCTPAAGGGAAKEWDDLMIPHLKGWFIQPLISYRFVVNDGLIHRPCFFSHWFTFHVSW